MALADLATDFSNTLSRGCSSIIIRDAEGFLKKLQAEVLYEREMGTADPVVTQAVLTRVARCGLALQQHDVPLLADLAQQILQVAGPDAIKFAIAPVIRVGTDRQGNQMPPIPSGFVDPVKFASKGRE